MKTITKIIVAIIVIIAIIAVASAMGGDSEEKNVVRYNYSIELGDSFDWTGSSGSTYTEYPDSGNQYAFVTFKVANDSYEDGFSNNVYIFETKLVINGVEYGESIDTYSYPGYELVTVQPGYTYTFVRVFEIPQLAILSDITLDVDYDDFSLLDTINLKLDTSL